MDIADNLSKMSYDPKFQVGCVVTSEDFQEVFSVGINGNASGFPNERDSMECGDSGFIHAEENAAIKCSIGRKEPKNVFVNYLPCEKCAKIVIMLGSVKSVFFRHFYGEESRTLEIFQSAGVNVFYQP